MSSTSVGTGPSSGRWTTWPTPTRTGSSDMGGDGSGAMIGAVKPVSWWMETCDDDLTPRPPLDGSIAADVAILGAGYTGLWTALHLLEKDPTRKVVILEREIAGWGASGRNGGWLSPEISVSHTEMIARHGLEATRATHEALVETIDHVEAAVQRHGIDAHLDRHGMLMLARGGHQMKTLRHIHEEMAEIGYPDFYRWLEPGEAAELVDVDNTWAALFAEPFAAVHPGRLVRGLARAVERLGGTIYEGTEVTGYVTGKEPALHTKRGTSTPTSSCWPGRPTSAGSTATSGRSSPSTRRSC